MLSKEINDLITRVGPNDGAGKVLRRYWQPAALTVELEGERPVAPVRLMGEDLPRMGITGAGGGGPGVRNCQEKGGGVSRHIPTSFRWYSCGDIREERCHRSARTLGGGVGPSDNFNHLPYAAS